MAGHNLTDVSTFTAAVHVPDPADLVTGASVEVAFQALANRTKALVDGKIPTFPNAVAFSNTVAFNGIATFNNTAVFDALAQFNNVMKRAGSAATYQERDQQDIPVNVVSVTLDVTADTWVLDTPTTVGNIPVTLKSTSPIPVKNQFIVFTVYAMAIGTSVSIKRENASVLVKVNNCAYATVIARYDGSSWRLRSAVSDLESNFDYTGATP